MCQIRDRRIKLAIGYTVGDMNIEIARNVMFVFKNPQDSKPTVNHPPGHRRKDS